MKKIVGVFDSTNAARLAIQDLKDQGYTTEDISVVSKSNEDVVDMSDIVEVKTTEEFDATAAGAATGTIVGGAAGLLAELGLLAIPGVGPFLAVGPIAAALLGAATGAGIGGVVGALVDLGFDKEEASDYKTYLEEGKILVMVDSDDDRVYGTFAENRSLNTHYYPETYRSGEKLADVQTEDVHDNVNDCVSNHQTQENRFMNETSDDELKPEFLEKERHVEQDILDKSSLRTEAKDHTPEENKH